MDRDKLPVSAGDFKLENPDKVERALYGSPNAGGEFVGGVIKEDGSWDDGALLAEYDRIGGYITRDGDKIQTGSFYDFANRKPRSKPEVSRVFRVEGQEIVVADGEDVPGIVQAKQQLEEVKKKGRTKKAKK